VSSTAGRNGGFRLFVGAPEDELLPVLPVAASVGVGAEPEPREKGPGTTEGVAKAYGFSLPADMIPTGKWWITDWIPKNSVPEHNRLQQFSTTTCLHSEKMAILPSSKVGLALLPTAKGTPQIVIMHLLK
jgi:hypothetical protein